MRFFWSVSSVTYTWNSRPILSTYSVAFTISSCSEMVCLHSEGGWTEKTAPMTGSQ